jgi:general stress protein 26
MSTMPQNLIQFGLREQRVDSMLAAARKTIDKVRYSWALTTSENVNSVRPMGHLPHVPGEDEWTIWFLTSGDSRKVADIRRDQRTSLVFQHDVDDAYVTLSGLVVLVEDPSEIQARWKERYNVFFPTEADRKHAMFFRLVADHAELWVRGVTPEPFGISTTTLKRDLVTLQWHVAEDGR